MSCEASGAPGATRAGGHLGLRQPPAGPRAWHPQDPRGQRFLVKSRPRLSMLASFCIGAFFAKPKIALSRLAVFSITGHIYINSHREFPPFEVSGFSVSRGPLNGVRGFTG